MKQKIALIFFFIFGFFLLPQTAEATVRVYGKVYYQAPDGTQIGMNNIPIRYNYTRNGNQKTFYRTSSPAQWLNNQWQLHTRIIEQNGDCIEDQNGLIPVSDPNGWYVFKATDSNSCQDEASPIGDPNDIVLCSNEFDQFTPEMPGNYAFPPGVPPGSGHFEPANQTGIPDGFDNSATYVWHYRWVPDLQPPSAPTISTSCQYQGATAVISGTANWSGQLVTGWWFDIGNNPSWSSATFYETYTGSNTTTNFNQSLSGFAPDGGVNFAPLQQNQTYYARVWNDYLPSATTSFTTPSCPVLTPTPTPTPPPLPTLKVGQGQNTTTQNPGFYIRSSGKLDSEQGTNFQNDIAIILEDAPGINPANNEYYVSFYKASISANNFEDLYTPLNDPKNGFILRYKPQNSSGNQYHYFKSSNWIAIDTNGTGVGSAPFYLYTLYGGPFRDKNGNFISKSWRVAFEKKFTESFSGNVQNFSDVTLKTAVYVKDTQTGLGTFQANVNPQAP